MNRREFLYGAATMIGALLNEAQIESIPIELSFPSADWPKVPIDFVGLSYENGQLYNPAFFASGNSAIIKAFRELAPKGVLRVGGTFEQHHSMGRRRPRRSKAAARCPPWHRRLLGVAACRSQPTEEQAGDDHTCGAA